MALKEALELQDDSPGARYWRFVGPDLLEVAEAIAARKAARQEYADGEPVEEITLRSAQTSLRTALSASGYVSA